MTSLLNSAAAFWGLLLLIATIATLIAFLYSCFLRKLFRARRIAHLRSQRMMREAAER
jgi:hypothetical protein